MSEEPKPCPFCGGETDWDFDPNGVCIFCPDCWASGPQREGWDNAISAWNRLTVLPEGWVAVPNEPTLGMENAGGFTDIFCAEEGRKIIGVASAVDIYQAMLAAAPKPEDDP